MSVILYLSYHIANMNKRIDFLIGEIMYINEQYQNLSLLGKKEYQYIGRDRKICIEEEQVLNEHVMDVLLMTA